MFGMIPLTGGWREVVVIYLELETWSYLSHSLKWALELMAKFPAFASLILVQPNGLSEFACPRIQWQVGCCGLAVTPK